MSVLRSHAGWKTKHFRGMTLEEIKEKFIHVWKQFEDFVPMSSKEERERVKRKGLKLEQRSAKKMKTPEEVSEEDLKGMMQLVPVEEVYVEALQVKHPIIDWEIHSEGKKDYWKIIRLGGHTTAYQKVRWIGKVTRSMVEREKEDDIFLSQDKYVGDILKKFGYSDVKSSNTPMDKENPWGKDGTGKDVDLHLYRSMIGSLMYLTASRSDIMFAVCACARHQVTPKECHLHTVKRIFRYLKGHPKLGLWYPKDSPFDLVAYSDSDYGGATQDRKSTTEGC
uniref:Reverse transcriptase Ty1/copia-type domain-containing protein n=1 Tax=Tanacetum cinerariifolium TaxID=118510 RepID=A0A699IBH6_TANCI|nr:hypothetical protein [Tanacetum cinerariifolium]